MTYTYEQIDLYELYDPVFLPPLDFLEECRRWYENPFHGTVETKIGSTQFSVHMSCGGKEYLSSKIKRLLFSEIGGYHGDNNKKLC